MTGRVPLGCNACDTCDTVSALYRPWPSCHECAGETCPSCAVPGSLSDDDGREHVLCLACDLWTRVDDANPFTLCPARSSGIERHEPARDHPERCAWCGANLLTCHRSESEC